MPKLWLWAALSGLVVIGCGGDTSAPAATSTTGGSTCTHSFACLGATCSCSDGPEKGTTCCDPNDATCTVDVCDVYCTDCE